MKITPGWDALAQVVRERRGRLGLTQEELADRGGPKTVTVRTIERAAKVNYRSQTLNRLDDALEWPSGTSIALVRGEVPEEFGERFAEWAESLVVRGGRSSVRRSNTEEALARAIYDSERKMHEAVTARAARGPDAPETRDAARQYLTVAKYTFDAMDMARLAAGLGASYDEVDRLMRAALGIYIETGTMAVLTTAMPDRATALMELFAYVARVNRDTRRPTRFDDEKNEPNELFGNLFEDDEPPTPEQAATEALAKTVDELSKLRSDPTQHAGVSGTAPQPEPSKSDLDLAAHGKRPGSTPVQDARAEQDRDYPDPEGPEGGA